MTLNDLIEEKEIKELMTFLNANTRGIGKTTHNLVMKFLDSQPKIMERFRQHGVIKPYGAYLIEHFLKL